MNSTIIITTYKRANALLIRAVESAINQIDDELEVLVIDDNGGGSPEQIQTEYLLKPFILKQQIQYVVLESNQGACAARNYGAELAKGEYLFFLDDDDAFLKHKVAVQSAYMQAHPNLQGCLAAMHRFDEFNVLIQSEANQPIIGDFEHYALQGNFFTPMLCIRREAYLSIGGMDTIPRFQDRYFMLKCLSKGYQFDCLKEPLHVMYEHTASRISSVSLETTKAALNLIEAFVQKKHNNLEFMQAFKALQYSELATTAYASNNYNIRLKAIALWLKHLQFKFNWYGLSMVFKSLWPFKQYHSNNIATHDVGLPLINHAPLKKLLWINHAHAMSMYHFKCLEALLKNDDQLQIDVYIKPSSEFKISFWHELAYIVDKRLYQFKEDPFSQIDLREKASEQIRIICELPQIQTYDWAICTLPYNLLPADILNAVKEGVIIWNIPQKFTQIAHLFKQKNMPLMFKVFLHTQVQGQWYAASNIKLNDGIINAYEKFAWYSQLSMQAFLTCQKPIYPIAIPRDHVLFRYLKLGGLYLMNSLFLVKRRLYQPKAYWRLFYKVKQQLQPIQQPKNTFWADPFPIQVKNKTYVFFEEMNFATQLGEIAYLELDAQNNILQKQTVLKNNTHFSFPIVFECEGAHYMLPENVQSNQLVVYKAHDFPNDWRPFKVLMNNIKLLDPIWFYHEGYYWIMGNKIHEFEFENNNALYVYFAKDLFAQDWTSHPMNPVVTDSEFARNAGKVIQKDAQLIRVSQNCSKSYGANVNFMGIIELTPSNYFELPIDVLKSPKGTKGLHTYNVLNDVAWTDVLDNE